MKKRMIILALAVFGFVGSANAMIAGLPLADSAVPLAPEQMRVSGGIVIGDDVNLYGARFSYGLMEDLAVFGDFGFMDPDYGDTGWGVQFGGLYGLGTLDLPFDLAARGTLGYTRFEYKHTVYDYDYWGGAHGGRRTVKDSMSYITVNVGAVASMDVEVVTLYGYLGLNYRRVSNGGSDSDTDAALGVGVLFNVNEQLSLYGELMHIDDPWFGLGVRYDF